MTTIPTQRPPDVDLTDEELQYYECATAEETEAANQRALDELGITYEELARQAREDEFQSRQARDVWWYLAP